MVNNDGFSGNQLTLSPELLLLFSWLTQHDAERLKKLIAHALSAGLSTQIELVNQDAQPLPDTQQLHASVIEFFALLEHLVLEALQDHTVKRAIQNNLMPTIDHIDSQMCSDDTLRHTIEQTTSKCTRFPSRNAKELLFEELLKCWQPHKKSALH